MRPSSALTFSPGAAGPLLRPDTPLDWMALAGCQYTDPEVFFPESGSVPAPARRICAACPVRAECLDYALGNGIWHGIWGGASERQRRRLSRIPPDLRAESLAAMTTRKRGQRGRFVPQSGNGLAA